MVSFKMTKVADTELVIITRLQAPVDSPSSGEVAAQPPALASREPQCTEHSGREHTAAGEGAYLAQLTLPGSKVKICYTHRWGCILHISIPRARHPSDA